MANYVPNGRVNILAKQYPEFQVCQSDVSSDGYDIVATDITHTPVSALFFSKTNIDALQQGICNRVFNDSQGRFNIGRQSEIELKIIMRSMYFDSLKNGANTIINDPRQNSVLEKVRRLNKSVLDWSVPRIISNIQQFEKYKADVSTMPNPMDRPSYLTSSGTKSLELQSFF